MRILIVDDDTDLQQVIAAALETHGFDAVVAPDPVRALEILSVAEVDAIVLDVMMPRLSGYELLEILRMDARTRLLPVLMLSALGDTKERIRGIRLGADDYLAKPFDPEELIVRLDRLVRQHTTPPGGMIRDAAKQSLAEALQSLDKDRWTGIVRLRTGQRHGQLEVHQGHLVAATFGLLSGPDAVYGILLLDEGIAVFDPTVEPKPRDESSEDLHLPSLTLKLAWLQDELKKQEESLPSPAEALYVARVTPIRTRGLERIPYTEVYTRIACLPGVTLEELEGHEFAPVVKVRLAVASLIRHGVLRAGDRAAATGDG